VNRVPWLDGWEQGTQGWSEEKEELNGMLLHIV